MHRSHGPEVMSSGLGLQRALASECCVPHDVALRGRVPIMTGAACLTGDQAPATDLGQGGQGFPPTFLHPPERPGAPSCFRLPCLLEDRESGVSLGGGGAGPGEMTFPQIFLRPHSPDVQVPREGSAPGSLLAALLPGRVGSSGREPERNWPTVSFLPSTSETGVLKHTVGAGA